MPTSLAYARTYRQIPLQVSGLPRSRRDTHRHLPSPVDLRIFPAVQPFVRRLARPETLILLLAVALRFWAIEIKPPHFDEGVNGWFADQMLKSGFYRYDPTNYHGPLHFYAVFLSLQLFGRELWALRLPALLAGVACVWLALRFERFLGSGPARWGALVLAVSPAMVFYARYSIHESWLVLFSMLTAWGIFNLALAGERRGLFALVAGLTGMILTKETYFIHAGCFVIAIPCLLLWNQLVPPRPDFTLARQQWRASDATAALIASVALIVFFYSGTFLNWPGVRGLYDTYAAWFATGVDEGGHAKTMYQAGPLNYYYAALLARYEWPVLLGLATCLRFLWPSPATFRYLAISGAGVLLAYSLIPYKTPWLVLSMLWPFAFLFGAVVAECRWREAAIAAGTATLTVSLLFSLRINFREFTNPREPYVYVQTFPEIRELTDPLLELARRDPAAHHLTGHFLLGSYYPLPWILGDFTGIGYFKPTGWPSPLDADFAAAEKSQAARVDAMLTRAYFRRDFRMRDAQEECVAWFDAEVFREIFSGEPELPAKSTAPPAP